MTILFLDQFSDRGGAQLCLLDLIRPAIEQGWKTVAAAPGNGPLLDLCAAQGACVEPIRQYGYHSGSKSPLDFLRFAAEIPRLGADITRIIKAHDVSLVYINGPRMLPAAAWANRGRAKAIFHAHSLLHPRYVLFLSAAALRRLDATLITSCRFVASPLHSHLPPERIHVVYNGVADCGFRAPSPRTPVHFGLIGRIAAEKGHHHFLEAVRLLSPRFPGCRFSIIGEPLFPDGNIASYHRGILHQAERLPVSFPGWTSDVAATLASLDFLVVPSVSAEATTRVIPEAWSAGVPVIASRIGGIAEIVEDNVTGFLTEPGSSSALAARMEQVMQLPVSNLHAVAASARRAYEQRFHQQLFRNRIVQLIDALLRDQPP